MIESSPRHVWAQNLRPQRWCSRWDWEVSDHRDNDWKLRLEPRKWRNWQSQMILATNANLFGLSVSLLLLCTLLLHTFKQNDHTLSHTHTHTHCHTQTHTLSLSVSHSLNFSSFSTQIHTSLVLKLCSLVVRRLPDFRTYFSHFR